MLLVLNSQMGHVGEMGQLILFDRGKLILYLRIHINVSYELMYGVGPSM